MSEPPFQIAQHNFVTHFDSTTYSIVCKKEEIFFMTFLDNFFYFCLFIVEPLQSDNDKRFKHFFGDDHTII